MPQLTTVSETKNIFINVFMHTLGDLNQRLIFLHKLSSHADKHLPHVISICYQFLYILVNVLNNLRLKQCFYN